MKNKKFCKKNSLDYIAETITKKKSLIFDFFEKIAKAININTQLQKINVMALPWH